ncbi:GD11156 [Drosophila simulans]|uniref:GD11156 n=1 Tax=Drosophila simulans TaxID=7240 RepID=B4QHE7_DROSI|nr:GD11156 [Drosophila simulans]
MSYHFARQGMRLAQSTAKKAQSLASARALRGARADAVDLSNIYEYRQLRRFFPAFLELLQLCEELNLLETEAEAGAMELELWTGVGVGSAALALAWLCLRPGQRQRNYKDLEDAGKRERMEQTKEQMEELTELEELETDRQSMLKSQLFVPALEASLHNFANEATHRSHLDPHPCNLFGCIRQ